MSCKPRQQCECKESRGSMHQVISMQHICMQHNIRASSASELLQGLHIATLLPCPHSTHLNDVPLRDSP
jgi:hypothetical protein